MIGCKKGQKSENVAYLQELLVEAGHLKRDPDKPDEVLADGKYGDKTVAAVISCRKSQGSKDPQGVEITGTAGMQIMKAFVRNVT